MEKTLEQLTKESIDTIFDNAEQQSDYVIGLYMLAYPRIWEVIQKVNGYPRISKATNEYIFGKAIAFDKVHHPKVIAGGLWMNNGFGGKDDIPDWVVIPCEVTLITVKDCTVCGAYMNPVERMLGPICGKCTDKAHEEATR